MKIKTSRWTLLSALLFTITTVYYYWKNPQDTIGIIIFALATIFFYIATIGNLTNGN